MFDAILAIVAAACAVPQLAYHARHNAAQFDSYLAFSAMLVLPLVWRRRFPLSTFAFASVIAFAQWWVGVEVAADATLLVYLYTVTSRYPLRVALPAAGVLGVGALMAAVRWPLTLHWSEMFVLLSGPVLAALLLGLNVRNRRSVVNALSLRAEQLERERDQQATIAAAEERTRIAREMHDVVAHSLLVMVTLSEGATLKHDREPERAARAMRQVSSTGRQALDDVRRLLGVLRTEGTSGSRHPQPGIAEIEGLLDRVRATGLAADFTVTGNHGAIPGGEALTVYRIVQEALTNVLKHAERPTNVRVIVNCGDGSLSVDVIDDGQPRLDRAMASATAGHGVAGMRERAAVYDGTVSAGPDLAGGWRVSARLVIPTGRPGWSRKGAAAVEDGDI